LASELSCVSAIAGEVAGPDVPKLIFVGLALAAATSSASDLYGSLASMTRTSGGPSAIIPIMAKSSIAL